MGMQNSCNELFWRRCKLKTICLACIHMMCALEYCAITRFILTKSFLIKKIAVQDDNITYITWAAWKSAEDLKEYLKSDDARKFIEYTLEEDIVTLVSGVRPIA